MNTREIATQYRLSQWAKVIREHTESGLSVKCFCESIGIHENTFYYRRKKLREVACSVMESGSQSNKSIAKANKSIVPKGWALCESGEPAASDKVLPIEIGECRVLAGTNVNPDLLAKVCRVLVAL